MFRIAPPDLFEEGVVAGEDVAQGGLHGIAGEDDIFHRPGREAGGDDGEAENDIDKPLFQIEFSRKEKKNDEEAREDDGEEIILGAGGDPSENGEEEKNFSFRGLEKFEEVECGKERIAPEGDVYFMLNSNHDVRNRREKKKKNKNGRACFWENELFDENEYSREEKIENGIHSGGRRETLQEMCERIEHLGILREATHEPVFEIDDCVRFGVGFGEGLVGVHLVPAGGELGEESGCREDEEDEGSDDSEIVEREKWFYSPWKSCFPNVRKKRLPFSSEEEENAQHECVGEGAIEKSRHAGEVDDQHEDAEAEEG